MESFNRESCAKLFENWKEERIDINLNEDEWNSLRLYFWTKAEETGLDYEEVYFIYEYELFEQDYFDTKTIEFDVYKGWEWNLMIYKSPISGKLYGYTITYGQCISEIDGDSFGEVQPREVSRIEYEFVKK